MKLSPAKFEALALEHVDMLFRLARRLTRERTSAEDLVQETYLRAFAARDGFDLKSYGIRPWLIRIMRNLHISRLQKQKRQPALADDEQLQEAAKTFEDPLESLSSSALSAAGDVDLSGINFDGLDEDLAAAVESLPVEYQTVLLLWSVDQLSYQEIADACDVPIGTVMSRLHRARKRVAERLMDDRVGRDSAKDGVKRE